MIEGYLVPWWITAFIHAVRVEAPDRRRSGIAVRFGIVDGEDALPRIRDMLAVRIVGAAPIIFTITAAPRRVFHCASVGRSCPRQRA